GHGGAATLVVVVGIAPGDRAAARRMGVVPVFHVVLLGHAGRAGIADVIVAQELLDLAGRLAIDEEPAPAFRLMRPARVPHRHRPRLARQQRGVGEDLAGGAAQARLFAAPTLPLLLAGAEVLGDERRIQIGGRRQLTGRENIVDRLMAAIGDTDVQLATGVALAQVAAAGARRPDAGQIDRAMADVVIGVAAEVLRRKLPIGRAQPLFAAAQPPGPVP